MNKRERILALIAVVTAVAFGGRQFLLPALSEHVFAVSDDNEQLREKLADLEAQLDEVEPYRASYKEFMARTGTTDAEQLQNDLFARLTDLVGKAGLSNPRVSPRKTAEYRPAGRKLKNAGVLLVRYSIVAEGKLDAIVKFLTDFYELPYIAQITSLKLDPPSGRARKKGGRLKFTAALEAMIPPAHPVSEVNTANLEQPTQHPKHSKRDYKLIASRKPFTEFIKPPPPKKIKKPPPKKVAVKEEDPPPPPPPAGDPNREQKVIRMVLMYGVDELLIENTRDRSSEYVGVGEKLDGGEVLFIHPLGAAARREDGTTLVYAVGKRLSECVPLQEAHTEYPEIVYAYGELKDRFEPPANEEKKEPPDQPTPGSEMTPKKSGEVKDKDAAPGKKSPPDGTTKPLGKGAKIPAAKGKVKKAEQGAEGRISQLGKRLKERGGHKPATDNPPSANKKADSVKPQQTVKSGGKVKPKPDGDVKPKSTGKAKSSGKKAGQANKPAKPAKKKTGAPTSDDEGAKKDEASDSDNDDDDQSSNNESAEDDSGKKDSDESDSEENESDDEGGDGDEG